MATQAALGRPCHGQLHQAPAEPCDKIRSKRLRTNEAQAQATPCDSVQPTKCRPGVSSFCTQSFRLGPVTLLGFYLMKLALALAYQRPSDRRWTPTVFSNLQCPEFSKSTAVSTSDGGTKASCERSRLQALPMLLVPFWFSARSACNQNGRRGLRKRTGCGAHRSPLSVSILRKNEMLLIVDDIALCHPPATHWRL